MSENKNEHVDQNIGPVSPRDVLYWKSLEEWSQTEAFESSKSEEFKDTPLRDGVSSDEGVDRRNFLKLMGASMALATAAGCVRRPEQTIIPYAKQPEEIVLGKANYYTSTWVDGTEVFGLLVKSVEGRPIKVEGNPEHPLNKGKLSARANAHILSLYDPERLQEPRHNLFNASRSNREPVSVEWEKADTAVVESLKKGGVYILTAPVSSPSSRALIAEFAAGTKAKWIEWAPEAHEDIRQAHKLSYGAETVPFYRFDRADVVVSVDADFLGTWLAPTSFSRLYAQRRRDLKNPAKLYSLDSQYSLTGANSDVRVRIKPSQQKLVLLAILREDLAQKPGSSLTGDSKFKTLSQSVVLPDSIPGAKIQKIATDLVKAGKKALVIAGSSLGSGEGLEIQLLVNALNSLLGADGYTVDHANGFNHYKAVTSDLSELAQAIQSGQVKTLIVHDCNPIYAAPSALGLAELFKKISLVIYTGDRSDETGTVAHYILPDHHAMEAWGDSEGPYKTFAIQQPTIRPLYNTRSFQLGLMTWAVAMGTGSKSLKDSTSYYDYLRSF